MGCREYGGSVMGGKGCDSGGEGGRRTSSGVVRGVDARLLCIGCSKCSSSGVCQLLLYITILKGETQTFRFCQFRSEFKYQNLKKYDMGSWGIHLTTY